MAVQPPNIPTLSRKVDTETRNAFAALKDWFGKIMADGGVVTNGSMPDGLVSSSDPAIAGFFDGTIPPQIDSFAATGAFRMIMLTWDDPRYKWFAYVEVWRNTADDLGTAQLIGTTISTLYSDMPPDASLSVDYYYWGRVVSTSGIKGPFNSTLGTLGSTANDPEYVLEILAGEITETELHQDLVARIDIIDDPVGGLLKQFDDLVLVYGDTAAASESAGIAVQASSDASGFASASSESAGYALASSGEAGDFAAAASASALAASSSSGSAGTYAYNSSQSAVAASQSATSSGTYATNASGYAATAVSAASTATSAAGVITAQYTIKVDVNGKVIGMGLWSDGVTSRMLIEVDEFAVMKPGAVAGTLPAIAVLTTPQTINGIAIPAGTYIDGANIAHLTANDGVIQGLAVDHLVVTDTATIWDDIINKAQITNAYIGEMIQSNIPPYVPGVSGWMINKLGQCEFQNIKARGDIEAASIKAGSVDIIGTLQIKENAVTVPIMAYTPSGMAVAANTWTTIQTFSMDTLGQPIFLFMNALASTVANSWSPGTITIKILEGSTEIKQCVGGYTLQMYDNNFNIFHVPSVISALSKYTPGSGVKTYTFQVYSVNPLTVSERSFAGLGVKR